jgi:hypothetical protein
MTCTDQSVESEMTPELWIESTVSERTANLHREAERARLLRRHRSPWRDAEPLTRQRDRR